MGAAGRERDSKWQIPGASKSADRLSKSPDLLLGSVTASLGRARGQGKFAGLGLGMALGGMNP